MLTFSSLLFFYTTPLLYYSVDDIESGGRSCFSMSIIQYYYYLLFDNIRRLLLALEIQEEDRLHQNIIMFWSLPLLLDRFQQNKNAFGRRRLLDLLCCFASLNLIKILSSIFEEHAYRLIATRHVFVCGWSVDAFLLFLLFSSFLVAP